jgi:DNA-binding CsgD family transcriptional regulator
VISRRHGRSSGFVGRPASAARYSVTASCSFSFAALALGRSNPAIATELVVSLDTVKKHVSHILTKLGASNRTEAVAHGRQLGLSN